MKRSSLHRHSCPSLQPLDLPHYPLKSVASKELQATGFSILEQRIQPTKNASFSSCERLGCPSHKRSMDSFVSPLTTKNLQYHTQQHAVHYRRSRFTHIASFVESQREMLKLELQLQQQRKAEIQSLIPLDLGATNQELIQDNTIYDEFPIPPSDHPQPLLNDRKVDILPLSPKKIGIKDKRPLQTLSRWIRLGKSYCLKLQRNHRSPPSPESPTPASRPRPTSEYVLKHTSWCPSIPYEQYKEEKSSMIRQALFDLRHTKMTCADGSMRDPLSHSDKIAESSSTRYYKRDSGISLWMSSTKSLLHRQKQDSASAYAQRRLSGSVFRLFPQPTASKEPKDELLAWRYPKMAAVQDLRDAAIQLLLDESAPVCEQPTDADQGDSQRQNHYRFSYPCDKLRMTTTVLPLESES
ncbi:uncharacterized protein BYT42DRAFT_571979 [Radiomyces spectabilis]|uniref:uncharacterized protein n=1 Tax=Radiomyces spectabilis TaxID=64574 RepID=UPI00221FCAEC|nr:uncharacterized protein BYT42DRAFT_571979 [Radiomyces spectabilis]KAI8377862.1 hypothetical protein BYT42DRAFT_571979 [Radiomyces spectabilis]